MVIRAQPTMPTCRAEEVVHRNAAHGSEDGKQCEPNHKPTLKNGPGYTQNTATDNRADKSQNCMPDLSFAQGGIETSGVRFDLV